MISTNDFGIRLPTIFLVSTNDFPVGRTPLKSLVRGVLAKNRWQEKTSCQRFSFPSNDLSLLALIFPRCDVALVVCIYCCIYCSCDTLTSPQIIGLMRQNYIALVVCIYCSCVPWLTHLSSNNWLG